MGYVILNAIVEKSRKGRRVYLIDGYAGKRELVESLLLRLKATIETDPEKPILKKA